MKKVFLIFISFLFLGCYNNNEKLDIVEIYYDGVKAVEVINGVEKEIELPKEKAGANITWLIQRERPSGAIMFGLNFGKLQGDVYNGVEVENTTTDRQIRINGNVDIHYDYFRISGDSTVTVNFWSNFVNTDAEFDNMPCEFIFRGGANEVLGKVAYLASNGEIVNSMIDANQSNEGLFNPLNPDQEDSINN